MMEDCKQGQSNGTTVEEILQKRLPVSKESASVDLKCYGVTQEGCSALTSALRSNSRLTELDLTHNDLSDSGVKILSDSLKECNLHKLSLSACRVTEEGCSALTSALRSNSRLTELDLTHNDLRDSGVKILSDLLKDSECNLHKLSLSRCGVTEEGCSALTSALRSNSRLTELDLDGNYLNDSGVKILSELLKNSHCNLHKLSLSRCGVTEEGCSALTSALRSNSRLTELDLTHNDLSDSGVKILSDSLKDSHCNLHKLSLSACGVTEEGCSALTSALRSNSRLTELDLSFNDLSNSGVKILSDSLKDSHCNLHKLSLRRCGVTEEGCSALTSALRSNSRLTELDLAHNDLSDSGVKILSDLLKDSECNLHKLSLSGCGVTEEGCSALTSALRSKSRLTELNLTLNDLRDSGVKILSELLKDSHCNLHKLSFICCGVTEEGCSALTSALRSNSRLTELDLAGNHLSNSGVKILSDSLKECNLHKLSLSACRVREEGCSALTSALRSNSCLTELDLDGNYLRDSGVKILSELLKDSECNLQKLSFSACGVTEEGCSALTSALRSNSRLTELDLTFNDLSDSGVKSVSELVKDSDCNLLKLSLIGR